MSTFPEPNPKQGKLSSQAGQANPATNNATIQEVRDWDREELIQWIQNEKPKLFTDEILKTFKEAYISGNVFLNHADDKEFFRNECKLPPGMSEDLALLATVLHGKSKCCCLHYAQYADSQLTTHSGQ
jgi:hypothetical protein